MNANPSFKDGVQVAWDSTSLGLAQTCLRKYYYRMILSVSPMDTSVHLVFGGIYASALERFYIHRAKGLSINEALREVVRYALLASWSHDLDSLGQKIEGTGQPISFNHSAKTRVNLIRSIVWYIDQFGVESPDGIRTHHLSSGKPAVELSFAIPLSDSILYCGHLDRVVEYGDHLYWMDQKTTGSTVSAAFFNSFSPDNQFSGYTWAGQMVLKSPVKGGIVDAAQIAVGFTRFERGFVTRTTEQLNEWIEGTFYTIELAQQATRENHFPMNLTACGNYGGCPYRELCSRSPSVRENFLKSNFQVLEPWSPVTPR